MKSHFLKENDVVLSSRWQFQDGRSKGMGTECQEAGKVVWYSHLFEKFPQFVVIHRVKGFGVVNKTEVDVFLELFCFFADPADVGNLVSGSSAFSKPSLNI